MWFSALTRVCCFERKSPRVEGGGGRGEREGVVMGGGVIMETAASEETGGGWKDKDWGKKGGI